MEAFVNFIKEYGSTIIAALSVIVGIVAVLVKRRPKTLDDFREYVFEVVQDLPDIINLCEDQCSTLPGSQGAVKKSLALTSACSALRSLLGRSLSKTEGEYAVSVFSKSIEDILSTPQKKGDELDGKKKLPKSQG